MLALALVAMRVVPPWYVPYLYGALWVVAVVAGAPSNRWRRVLPVRLAGWAGVAFFAVLGALDAYASAEALLGRRLPERSVANVALPFGDGTFLVAHGGSREIVNVHMKTLGGAPRFRAWRGQSYAVDLIRIDRSGRRAGGWRPVDPSAYLIFGMPVLAPSAGRVVQVEDELPDMPVPLMDREHLAGNHVLLDCGGFHLLLAHLREGSLEAGPDDAVARCDVLGEVGNSGNSSEPHLHLHAQMQGPSGAPFAGDPVALTIDGVFPVRNMRLGP